VWLVSHKEGREMNIREAEELVANINIDDQYDLLMYLAEVFVCHVEPNYA